jgi:hypothetical protein
MKNIKNTITTTITNLRTRAITGIVNILIPDPGTLIESIKAHAVCNLADLINTDEICQSLADDVSRDLSQDDVMSYIMYNGMDLDGISDQIARNVADDFNTEGVDDAIIDHVKRNISDCEEIEDRIIDRIMGDISVDEDDVTDRIVENYEVDESEIIDRIVDDIDIDSKIDALLRRKVADAFRRIADEMSA